MRGPLGFCISRMRAPLDLGISECAVELLHFHCRYSSAAAAALSRGRLPELEAAAADVAACVRAHAHMAFPYGRRIRHMRNPYVVT